MLAAVGKWFWQVLWGVTFLTAVFLIVALLAADRKIADLNASIEDPTTGYIAKGAICTANAATLRSSIKAQDDKIDALKTQTDALLKSAQLAVDIAHAQSAAANRRFEAIMSAPPAGNTVCERVLDVDHRFLETLQ